MVRDRFKKLSKVKLNLHVNHKLTSKLFFTTSFSFSSNKRCQKQLFASKNLTKIRLETLPMVYIFRLVAVDVTLHSSHHFQILPKSYLD